MKMNLQKNSNTPVSPYPALRPHPIKMLLELDVRKKIVFTLPEKGFVIRAYEVL